MSGDTSLLVVFPVPPSLDLAEAARRALSAMDRQPIDDGTGWEARWLCEDLATPNASERPAIVGSCPGLVVWGLVSKFPDVLCIQTRLLPLFQEIWKHDASARINFWVDAEEAAGDGELETWDIHARADEDWELEAGAVLDLGPLIVAEAQVQVQRFRPGSFTSLPTSRLGKAPKSAISNTLFIALQANTHDEVADAARVQIAQVRSAVARAFLKELAGRSGETIGPKGGFSLWAHRGESVDVGKLVRELKPFFDSIDFAGVAWLAYLAESGLLEVFFITRDWEAEKLRIGHERLSAALFWHPELLER